jgi:hypothetical protein
MDILGIHVDGFGLFCLVAAVVGTAVLWSDKFGDSINWDDWGSDSD